MTRHDIPFTLRDGRKALIRSPRDEDIPGMLDYLYVSSGETEYILRYPEECGKYTPEGEKAVLSHQNAILDIVRFDLQTKDVSWALKDDGTWAFSNIPTPGAENQF